MGQPDDDGMAPTLARDERGEETQPASRPSRPAIDGLAAGMTIGRYRLVDRLGAGAMGVVWSAHDPQLDRRVAIKLLNPHVGDTPEAAGRLLREARAMAKLSHRNVITVHDAGDVDGHLFIAMELVEGTTLGAMLRARVPGEAIDWRRWVALLVDAGRGLEAAHARGVLHRDFKPDNVLVDRAGRVCVGDFGVAQLGETQAPRSVSSRAPSSGLASSSDLTTTGALLGTPLYMSPQQLQGAAVDARADQFSFCVTAWEALYGARPFHATGGLLEAIASLVEQIERGELPPAPADSSVPVIIRGIVARGLTADPAARWPSLGALLAALEAATRRRVRPWLRRRWPLALAAIAVGVAGAALVVRRDRGAAGHDVELEPLLGASLHTIVALSPDGRRLALGSDTLEVRDLHGDRPPWRLGLEGASIAHLELDAQHVRFAQLGSEEILRWDYATTGNVTNEGARLGGEWRGTTAFGELVWQPPHRLAIVDGGRERDAWTVQHTADVIAISPDRSRIAYLDTSRYTGALIVRDLGTSDEVRVPLVEPTATSWLDDRTVLYATGTSDRPQLFRVTIADGKAGEPALVFEREHGWFGHLSSRGPTVLLTELAITSRAILHKRRSGARDEFDSSKIGAALGWVSADEYLTWHARSTTVERRTTSGTVTPTPIKLGGEPANATFSDDMLIVAVRGTAGRVVSGIDTTTGEVKWSTPGRDLHAVRCAGDRRPPCFAVVSTAPRDRIVRFDPVTGQLGDTVFARPADLPPRAIEDVAINDDGTRLIVAGATPALHEIGPTGELLRELKAPASSVRSIAYDPDGGVLIAGTIARNRYQVGELRDTFRDLGKSDNEIQSLVRPSSDGAHVLVLARRYEPFVSLLDLSRR